MTAENKAQRLALYDQLRQERYGPVGRLRRERGRRPPAKDDDSFIQLARLRVLSEATGGSGG